MPISGNLLLAVKIKKTSKVDLKGPILKYIQKTYGPHVAEDAGDDLDTIQQLRNSIASANGTSGSGLQPLAQYYRALTAIESRFPISSDPTQIQIVFTWWDSFKDTKKATQKNIHFEKCGVLFCLAAMASQQGIDAQRADQAGMQEACTAFCAAAGIFAYLRNNVTIKTDQPRPVDISGDCCAMLEKLMLAQAQEVFYELVCAKGQSASMAASIAKQVAVLYNEAAGLYQRPALMEHFEKSWLCNSRAKAIMYDSEALLQQAYQHRRDNRHREFLTRLRHSLKILEDHRKDVKLANSELQRHVKAVEDKVRAELVKAEDDNLKIYMDTIPDPSTLPPIAGKMLVNSKVPDYLSKGSERWFADIVPDKVAKSLSRYTEEMDGTVRAMLQKLEGATDEARLALVQYGLPEALDSLNATRKTELPDDLRMAFTDDFVTSGGVHHLQSLVRTGAELRAQVESQLRQCSVVLDEESSADNKMRSKWNAEWRRPSSHVLDAPLRETIARYESNLKAAGESDMRVHTRLEANIRLLAGLVPEQAASRLPHLQAPMVHMGSAEPSTVVSNLRQALVVLGGLSQERAAIEERIKDTRDKDNVLPELLGNPNEDTETLYKRSLEKYATHEKSVDDNLARQQQIMDVIAQNMSAFKAVFDVSGWEQECKGIAAQIKKDIATGHELMSNLKEGIEFYTGLSEAVKSLMQMCSDYALTRAINLEELDQDLTQKQSVVSANEAAARALREEEQRRHDATKDLAAMRVNAPPEPAPTSAPGQPQLDPHAGQYNQPAYPPYYGSYPTHAPPAGISAQPPQAASPYSQAYPQQPFAAPPAHYYYQQQPPPHGAPGQIPYPPGGPPPYGQPLPPGYPAPGPR